MPGVATGNPLIAPQSRDIEARLALITNGTKPTARIGSVTITEAAAGGTVSAGTGVSLTTTSFTPAIPILAGTFLAFKDSAGTYLAKVDTTIPASATTSITITLYEDLPQGAAATWPVKLDLLTDFSSTDTTGTNSFSSFDHSGTAQVARGNSEQSFSLSGGYSWYSDGIQTILYAKRTETDIYIERQLPNPDANAFTTNTEVEWAAGIVTDASRPGQNEQVVNFNATVSISGGFEILDPA